MKRMLFKRLAWLSLVLMTSTAWGGADNSGWSEPVNGLRARLSVLPPEKKDTPFCRVFIELENTADVAGQKKIRFNPEKLSLKVTGEKSKKELPLANAPYDGISPLWETIALPYAGSIRFQISFPGLGYRPDVDKVIVDINPRNAWVIPQDGDTYSLSGSLSIEREKSDHALMDWSGTLELPVAGIPAAATFPAASASLAPPTEPLDQKLVGVEGADPIHEIIA